MLKITKKEFAGIGVIILTVILFGFALCFQPINYLFQQIGIGFSLVGFGYTFILVIYKLNGENEMKTNINLTLGLILMFIMVIVLEAFRPLV